VSQEKFGYSDGTGKLAAKLLQIAMITRVKKEYNMIQQRMSRHVTQHFQRAGVNFQGNYIIGWYP
jgi:hypothetical protein